MNKAALLVPLALGTSALLPLSGCSSNYNRAEREAAPEAQGRPDYATMTEADLKLACIGSEEGRPWLNGKPPACTPDAGSRPVNQAEAENGLTFVWIWNFTTPGERDVDGRARATYTYDDNTALFVVPERDPRSNGALRPEESGASAAYSGWMPKADDIPTVPGITFSKAIRLRGGPFTEFGGGFGQTFRTPSNKDSDLIDEQGVVATPPSSPEFLSPDNGAYDLSSFDGIAIWVRRGPLGMSTLRVGITEKHSAEDLNSGAIRQTAEELGMAAPGIEEGQYCRRWRLCGCAAGTPCTDGKCYDPALGQPPADAITCGPARCREQNTSTTAADPLFVKPSPNGGDPIAACNAYTTSDGRSDMFCYDPALDPPPPAKRERCNNPFSRPVTVTTDWQLIKVPFSELLQADEGYVARDKDLASVKQIVVTHGAGWTDFWIGNVGFYKATK